MPIARGDRAPRSPAIWIVVQKESQADPVKRKTAGRRALDAEGGQEVLERRRVVAAHRPDEAADDDDGVDHDGEDRSTGSASA